MEYLKSIDKYRISEYRLSWKKVLETHKLVAWYLTDDYCIVCFARENDYIIEHYKKCATYTHVDRFNNKDDANRRVIELLKNKKGVHKRTEDEINSTLYWII